jgi:glutaconate CoA-transferase, subunit B
MEGLGMNVRQESYTLEEQIVCQIARCFKPTDVLGVNSPLMCGLTALALAQRLYAPEMLIQREVNGRTTHLANFRLPFDPGHPPEDSLEVYLSNERAWELVFGGKWNIVMQPVQIDRFGNTNLSLVGNRTKPTVVFVGSRGLPDNTVNCERVYYLIPEHTTKSFVERVDFLSGVGRGAERKSIHIDRGAPHLVFSNLGVFDFDESTGRMRIRSIHIGVTLDDIVRNTGFELLIPTTIPETPAPNSEELHLLREVIDPLGMRRLDFAKGDDYKAIQEQIKQARLKTNPH